MSRTTSVVLSLVGILVFFALIVWIGGMVNPDLKLDQTALMRFAFVIIGLLIAFVVYWPTRENTIWQVGTRQVVYMAIGAALYVIFSYLFNGTVFVVPSVSQVALRPAIVIPMFFGYTLLPDHGGAAQREPGRHQARVPQARPEVPPGRQQGKECRGEVQGAAGGARSPEGPGEARRLRPAGL